MLIKINTKICFKTFSKKCLIVVYWMLCIWRSVCYSSEQWRKHTDKILLHFSNRTLHCYFEPKWPEKHIWSEMQPLGLSVVQIIKLQGRKYISLYILFQSHLLCVHWLVLGYQAFVRGREALLELLLFLTN